MMSHQYMWHPISLSITDATRQHGHEPRGVRVVRLDKAAQRYGTSIGQRTTPNGSIMVQ